MARSLNFSKMQFLSNRICPMLVRSADYDEAELPQPPAKCFPRRSISSSRSGHGSLCRQTDYDEKSRLYPGLPYETHNWRCGGSSHPQKDVPSDAAFLEVVKDDHRRAYRFEIEAQYIANRILALIASDMLSLMGQGRLSSHCLSRHPLFFSCGLRESE